MLHIHVIFHWHYTTLDDIITTDASTKNHSFQDAHQDKDAKNYAKFTDVPIY